MPGGATEFTALQIDSATSPLVEEPPITYLESPANYDDEFWYKYTPTADGAMGCRASLASGTTFDPHLEVYYGTPGSLDLWFSLVAVDTRPATVPLLAGTTVYFRVFGSSNLGTPAVSLQVSFYKAPLETISEGDLFIPDDTAFEVSPGEFVGFPGAVIDSSTGEVQRLQIHTPACETGDILPDGTILLDNSYDDDQLHLLNPDLTLKALITPPVAHDSGSIVHHVTRYSSTAFMVGSDAGSASTAWTVDYTGAIGGITWTLASALVAIGYDASLGIIYFAAGGPGAAVQRYIIGSGAASNLAGGVSGHRVVSDGIVVLEDGSILVAYRQTSPQAGFIRRYDIAGTVLQTYTMDSAYVLNRICRALDSPETFWVWLHRFIDPNETSRFLNLNVTSGDTLTIFDAYQSNAGIGPLLADPPRFGHSFSCPFMQLPGSDEDCDCTCPPTGGGGGTGHTGGNEGDDPTRTLTPWSAMCDFGGDVPSGINGTDTENWAA